MVAVTLQPSFSVLQAKKMVEFKKAFSLVELIIIVLILGALAWIVVPRLQFAAINKQRADTIARKIVTDFRRTRRLAIINAADNSTGFELNMAGSSPYSSYQIVNSSTSEVVDTHNIDATVSITGGNNFEFGPLGNLLGGSDTQLTVSSDGRSFTISIIAATGAAKCSEN